MNRRELLRGLMAGGMIVAGELWVPGQTLISIPSKKFYSKPILFELNEQVIKYRGADNTTVSIKEFVEWLAKNHKELLNATDVPDMVSLKSGYRIENPEHLVDGTLAQDRVDSVLNVASDREYWSSTSSLGDADLVTDKVYGYTQPRERITENDLGGKGWR